MFLGRFTQGQFLPVPVTTRDGATPYVPPIAPIVSIYNSAGTKIGIIPLPPVDRSTITGMFVGLFRLDSTCPAGLYRLACNYTANGVVKLAVGHFEVVAGGDADGAVISLFYYPRPQASFLIAKLDSDKRMIGQNPRVS